MLYQPAGGSGVSAARVGGSDLERRVNDVGFHADIHTGKVLIQPHCHQYANGLADDGLPSGTSATVEVLKECGYEVEVLDAGCCGMAGTFGYEAGHDKLSMKVGERLFHELENKKKDVIVSGSGAACRMQIGQGAGVGAVHPASLVRDALLGS